MTKSESRLFGERLRKYPFLSAAVGIGGATSLAQGIAVLASPALTRLFSPSEFGSFVALNSMGLVLSVGIAMRLHLAIPLPKTPDEAKALVWLGLWSLGGMSLVLFAGTVTVTLLTADERLLGVPLVLLPAVPILAGTYAAFALANATAIREGRFGAIARRQLIVAIVMVACQLAAGSANLGVVGLLVATVIAQLVGVISLIRGTQLFGRPGGFEPRTLLRRYWRFPVMLAPAGWVNAAANQGQVVMVSALYSSAAAGWFGLVERVMSVPLTLVGQSVAQVYLSELSRGRRGEHARERELFIRTSWILFGIALSMVVIVMPTGPWLFAWVFGEEWRSAGAMARPFVLAAAAQLVTAPLSQTLVVYSRFTVQLALDATRLCLVTASLFGAAMRGASVIEAVWCMALAVTVTCCVTWLLCYQSVSRASIDGNAQ